MANKKNTDNERKKRAEIKFAYLYDASKRVLLIIDSLYSDFEKALILLIKNQEEKEEVIINIYSLAFSLIDNFHRFHQLIQSTTLLSKKLPEVIRLDEIIEPVKNCRNYLQHMRGDLANIEDINFPIFGVISWIDGNHQHVLFPNQEIGYAAPSITIDTLELKYLNKYLISVGGKDVPIDRIYHELKVFWNWLEKISKFEKESFKEYKWGKPQILSFSIKKGI
ncbi:MAG: hypothetical protein GY760_14075 [Deltaproteobacteria bacterium]|nr:hypothetical protein [Deltaproteobacteria bacterium]